MTEKRAGATLLAEIRGERSSEEYDEFKTDVRELIETLSGYELVDAVISRVNQFVEDEVERLMAHGENPRDQYFIDGFRAIIRFELTECISHFVSDAHREFVVCAHARGLSTSAAVSELIEGDETIHRLAEGDALGHMELQRVLVLRLAYLKPGTARWPEKKYGAVWREARAAYKQAVTDYPLMTKREQAALIAKHAERIDYTLETKPLESKDFQVLTNTLMQTLERLDKLTEEKERTEEALSHPQLFAVLERLTLALRKPDEMPIGSEAEALAGILERVALELKQPEQKTGGIGPTALPAPGDGEKKDSDS